MGYLGYHQVFEPKFCFTINLKEKLLLMKKKRFISDLFINIKDKIKNSFVPFSEAIEMFLFFIVFLIVCMFYKAN